MKIAFMFLIGDSIEFEDVWGKFFDKADKNKYSIYVHPKSSKTKLKSKRFKNAIIPSAYTAWGDLLLAEMQLFKYAYKTKSNEIFVLISNTTIPVKSFSHVYNVLSKRTKSMVKKEKARDYDYAGAKLKEWGIKLRDTYRSDQWVTLIRPHVELLLKNTNLIEDWGMRGEWVIGDEVYIPTLLMYYKKSKEMEEGCDTWIDWGKKATENSPATYKKVELNLIVSIIASEYLFARKFLSDATVIVNKRKVSTLRQVLFDVVDPDKHVKDL